MSKGRKKDQNKVTGVKMGTTEGITKMKTRGGEYLHLELGHFLRDSPWNLSVELRSWLVRHGRLESVGKGAREKQPNEQKRHKLVRRELLPSKMLPVSLLIK